LFIRPKQKKSREVAGSEQEIRGIVLFGKIAGYFAFSGEKRNRVGFTIKKRVLHGEK